VDTTVDAGTRREQRTLAGGAVAGLLGGLALAVPVVIWDWASSSHRALELPMAVTAWSFGLVHFSHIENLWWPIVIGVALLAVYWAAVGVVFAALADRLFRPAEAARTIAAGAAWSFVSFIFTWYMLLPIARGGAPFMAAPLPATPGGGLTGRHAAADRSRSNGSFARFVVSHLRCSFATVPLRRSACSRPVDRRAEGAVLLEHGAVLLTGRNPPDERAVAIRSAGPEGSEDRRIEDRRVARSGLNALEQDGDVGARAEPAASA
jgi:hypothetical protein